MQFYMFLFGITQLTPVLLMESTTPPHASTSLLCVKPNAHFLSTYSPRSWAVPCTQNITETVNSPPENLGAIAASAATHRKAFARNARS